jgi:hypothetical protein
MTGRPSDFRREYIGQAHKLALVGLIDAQVAEFFEVNERTINRWKKRHPEFCQALKDGKTAADAAVADRLHQRALGFEYEKAIPIKVKEVVYDKGKRIKETERVEVTMVHEVVPPDTTACIFWLKNRQRDQWREKMPDVPPDVDPHEVARQVRDAVRAIAEADGLDRVA